MTKAYNKIKINLKKIKKENIKIKVHFKYE